MHDLFTQRSSYPEMPTPLTSRQLFLIVKNPCIADMMTWVLKLAGYRLTKGEAPTLSHIPPEDPPAAILLDVGFLPTSANQALSEVQAQCAALEITAPIILLTTSPTIQKEMEHAGYQTLLQPFHIEHLNQTVREALSSLLSLPSP
jgi:DNA-binding NtrC family response regulator